MVYKKQTRKKTQSNQSTSEIKQRQAATLRRRIKALMHNECFICEYHTCLRALELHHVVPTRKKFNISMNILRYKWDTIVFECKKCVLLCNRCHTEVEDGITEVGNVPSTYYNKLQKSLQTTQNRQQTKRKYSSKTTQRKNTKRRR